MNQILKDKILEKHELDIEKHTGQMFHNLKMFFRWFSLQVKKKFISFLTDWWTFLFSKLSSNIFLLNRNEIKKVTYDEDKHLLQAWTRQTVGKHMGREQKITIFWETYFPNDSTVYSVKNIKNFFFPNYNPFSI